jgi:uncharacterized protein with HEPN domain
MPSKDPSLCVVHISGCCNRIVEYTEGLGTTWAESQLLLDAVCRNVEIIGEAASRLDVEFRDLYPQISRRAIIDTRNILVHACDSMNASVWRTSSRETFRRCFYPLTRSLKTVHPANLR